MYSCSIDGQVRPSMYIYMRAAPLRALNIAVSLHIINYVCSTSGQKGSICPWRTAAAALLAGCKRIGMPIRSFSVDD